MSTPQSSSTKSTPNSRSSQDQQRPDLPTEPDLSIPIELEPAVSGSSIADDPGVLKYLDPKDIRPSGAPNRLEDSFDSDQYETLRQAVLASRGNTEAITVREIAAEQGKYVLITGERRCRVCLEEDLPVLAIVLPSDTKEAEDYLRCMRENIARADLSVWEFGMQVHHMKALHPKMSLTALADQLGVSVSKVSRAYELGKLPNELVEAFDSPAEIRVDDMIPLRDAYKRNVAAVIDEVARIRQETPRPRGPAVVERIDAASRAGKPAKATKEQSKSDLAPCKKEAVSRGPQPLSLGDRDIGQWSISKTGRLELRIDIAMSDAQREALLTAIGKFAESRVLPKQSKEGVSRGVKAAAADEGAVRDDGAVTPIATQEQS